MSGSPPEVVANAILHALVARTPRPEYRVGRGSRHLPLLAHLLPTGMLDRVRRQALGLARLPAVP